ncbi:MAG: 4Fe-4S cluster-binding domain-containing protein [Ruminococcaceae bacterium]|nr:4Fe-4S cluster-binding domain-containing protein [Oscillospiraceae bacterium]
MLSYSSCRLCPRQCGVDRTAGQLGYCRMPARLSAARAMVHYWEEPVISGSFGSGAVFFSGCTLGCAFCQNEPISHGGLGKEITADRLREIFETLIDDGCQNINLVTPTQFLPTIIEALEPKLPVPVVYNCGGYERVEILRELEGKVDVYLPDYKYADAALAGKLSAAPNYPEIARAAILEMLRQTGPCEIVDGELRRGTLVRHLVLPGYVENSLAAVEWLAEVAVKHGAMVSIMGQYVPMPGLQPPLDRHVTEEEYAAVLSWAQLCGLRDGFFQDLESASTTYIPDFSLQGL